MVVAYVIVFVTEESLIVGKKFQLGVKSYQSVKWIFGIRIQLYQMGQGAHENEEQVRSGKKGVSRASNEDHAVLAHEITSPLK